MKLYTYARLDGSAHLAVELRGNLYDLEQFGLFIPDMNALIDVFDTVRNKIVPHADMQPLDRSCMKLLAPIVHPKQDIICLGINYAAHAEEAAKFHSEAFGFERRKTVYFSKRASALTGDGAEIPSYPGLVDSLDYECELAVVIGRDAFGVPKGQSESYIFGYTILNDVSARNLQTAHQQWYFGKSLDGFTPCGPCIVTADEIAFPPALRITSRINGELRQDSNTSLLIRTIPEIIAELSQGMTLRAGTILATGTPAGVGMGFDPPKFLQPGDEVICEIEGIGALRNIVK